MYILRVLLSLAVLAVSGNATPEHDALNIITRDDNDISYRLPTNVVPTAYSISIEPNFEDFSFTGESVIDINVVEATDTITLHVQDINIVEKETKVVDPDEPKPPKPVKKITKRSIGSTLKNTVVGDGDGKPDTVPPVNGDSGSENPKVDTDENNNPNVGADGDKDPKGGKDDDKDPKGDIEDGKDPKGDKDDDKDPKDDKHDDKDPKGNIEDDKDPKGDKDDDKDPKGDKDDDKDPKDDKHDDKDPKGDIEDDKDPKGDKDDDKDPKGDKDDDKDPKGDKDDDKDPKGDKDDDKDPKGDKDDDKDPKGDKDDKDPKGDKDDDKDPKGDKDDDKDPKGDKDDDKDPKGDKDDDKDPKGDKDDDKDPKGDKDDDKDPKELLVVSHTKDADKNFLMIKLNQELKQKSYRLTLHYTGKISEGKNGFFRTFYTVDEDKQRWLVATHFEPVAARKAFPCWDEPAIKAPFTISINHPIEYTAVSNMPIKSKDDDAKSKTSLTTFQTSPPMSTYLVAYVVSDYGNLTNDENNFNVWTRKNALDHVHYAHDVGQKILEQFAAYTGIDYPLPKMDQITIPGMSAGAMENWGLVTYRETSLLYDENVATTQKYQSVANIIAHEFAHQWFGDLVGPDRWEFVWLNEGFATYFSYHAMDIIEPNWRMMDQFLVKVVQGTAFVYDTVHDVRPMNYAIENPKQVGKLFDSISYEKSASVIRMMSHIVTSKVFKEGLRKYLKENSQKSATSDKLFASIQQAVSKSDDESINMLKVAEIMNTWVKQRGYPVVTVTRNYEGKKAVITQERFYLSKPEKPDTHKWSVPLNYATESKPDFNTTVASSWLKSTNKKTELKIDDVGENEWIIFNVKQTGYYRVNYDERNWEMIAAYLDSDKYATIDPANRAQLIDDALNLARAGLLNYGLALNVTAFLSKETDFIVWQTALRNFAFLERMLAQSENYETFQNYNAIYLSNFLNTLNLEESDKDEHFTKLIRSEVIHSACYYGVEACINHASTKFEDWLTDSAKFPLSSNVRDSILCAGLREAGEDIWNKTIDEYKNKNEDEKKAIVAGLGCANTEETLWRYLNMALQPKSEIKDSAGIINAVIEGSRLGVNLALDFISENYDNLTKKLGGEAKLKQHFTKLGEKITTTNQYGKFALLLAQKAIPEEITSVGLKNAESNVAWVQGYEPDINLWLTTNDWQVPKEEESKGGNGASVVSMAFMALVASLLVTRLY